MAGARARLQVLLVLTALGGDSGFEVLFIKNRLMLEFDADAAGGYRDMLINLQCRESGHMVEVGAGPSPYCRACLGRRCIRTTSDSRFSFCPPPFCRPHTCPHSRPDR
mgnify:CR=1 FL=1